MTIGSILLGVALLGLVALYVSRPIFAGHPHRRRKMSERKALSLQKEAVLTQIKALDFDYETGKVDQEEYQQQREAYIVEAADLMMRIDALDAGHPLDATFLEDDEAPVKDDRPATDHDEIEAAIARRRAKAAPAADASAAAAPPVAQATSGDRRGNFCPQCGETCDPGDHFCAYCGHQLAQPQHA